MTYTAIAAGIKNILDGVTGLAVAYDYEPKELGQYPAATLTALSHADTFADLAANSREFTFAIRVYYRTEDAASAESVVRGIVDDIIAAIESDVTLGGVCNWAKPTGGTWAFGEREVPVRYCQITLTARIRVMRSG